ncbi:MAG TPA: NADH:flavin oxidoreductase/NADH oxidase [Nitrospirota bacterium]|nr:NADH:flavin oxidoreductase/NADH oxidase [Nitrospirota bacterium]
MSRLFSPLKLRDLAFRNRIFVSPMCQYSSLDGIPTDWHLVHLGSRAVGGAGLVMVEATAVSPEGRISPNDSGIWSYGHAEAFKRITQFIRGQGAVAGVQLAHAGRKASTDLPWRGGRPLSPDKGGWTAIAPSAVPFSPAHPVPRAVTAEDLERIRRQFGEGAERALKAGFEVVEIHMAHGYLLHEFLSPLANKRNDEYGGSLANRMRFPLIVAQTVREIWPAKWPVFVRISATDWMEGGWDLDQSVELSLRLKDIGIDLIDCSSGGLVMLPETAIPAGPGYQTPFATAIRQKTDIATATVGLITAPAQAEQIVASGLADAVILARELLRNPYWPLMAAQALKDDIPWPVQYERARLRV